MTRLLQWLFALFLADRACDDKRIARLAEARYRRLLARRLAVEGDTLESVEAKRQALLRLYREIHRF